MKQKVKPLSKKEIEFWEDYEDFREVFSPILDENDEPIILPGWSEGYIKEYNKKVELWKKKNLKKQTSSSMT